MFALKTYSDLTDFAQASKKVLLQLFENRTQLRQLILEVAKNAMAQ